MFCWGGFVGAFAYCFFFRGLLFFVLFAVVDDDESQTVSRIVFTNITSNRTWAIKKRKKTCLCFICVVFVAIRYK